jgi:MYXO-CTERM domain-containing protein
VRLKHRIALACLLCAVSLLPALGARAEGRGEAPENIEHPPVDFTGSEGTPPIPPEPQEPEPQPPRSGCRTTEAPSEALGWLALLAALAGSRQKSRQSPNRSVLPNE